MKKTKSMKRKRRLALKLLACFAIAGLTVMSTITIPIKTDAATSQTEYTVMQGTPATATFTHEHKHNGTAVTDALIQTGETHSGYSQSGPCYTDEHVHVHEGDDVSGGVCYEGHLHVAGSGGYVYDNSGTIYYKSPGGCYTKAQSHDFQYHSGNSNEHTETCPACGQNTLNCATHNYTCRWCGSWKQGGTTRRCSNCGYNGDYPSSTSCNHTGYVLDCGKSESSYQAKDPCGFYTDPVYELNCGIEDGAEVAKVTVSADANNLITYAVDGKDSHAQIEKAWTIPTGSAADTSGDTLQCDVPGDYICTVRVTVIGDNGEIVDDDTVTFTYAAVAKNTTVNLLNEDGTTFKTYTMKAQNETGTVDIITKTGYAFNGWYNGTEKIYSDTGALLVTGFCPLNGGTINLTPDLSAKTYQINYYTQNADLETPVTINENVTFDQANVKLAQSAKTYTGYTFLGWYNGETKVFDTDGTYLETSGTWKRDANLSVTAKYQANSYKLNFSLSKDEDVDANSKDVTYDAEFGLTDTEKANRKEHKGYTFKGWLDATLGLIFNPDGTNANGNTWKYTQDVNAKATYEANPYTVTYYVENPDEETTVSVTDTFTYDTSNIKLSKAVKSYNGWTLDGFYNGATKVFNADGTFVRDTWDIEENITVTPKWVPKKYRLNFSLDKEEAVTAHSKEIPFNSVYGLTDAEKAARKTYKGYTFNGWYDDDNNLIFDADGNNTDTGIWRFLNTVNAKATYTPNPYTVYYNTNEADAPSQTLAVTFDADYRLPEGAVNSVPKIDGYTFDGWFDADGNKVFKVNGTPVNTPYDYDHDITVYVKYHKNKYTIHYNNGTVSDETLDKTQIVTFDESYLDITEAPYKKGYVFDGHSIKGTTTFIWDGKGNKTHAIWDFVCGVDGTEIDAVKNYHPKEFTVSIGSDLDNDGVIDSVEQTATATYDATYFDLAIPASVDGYTFDGYMLLEQNKMIATYNPSTGTLTKESSTWVYDDNLNWVDDAYTGTFTVVKKWHKNQYTVYYNNTTTTDITLPGEQKVIYGTAYSAIERSPYKKGYVFQGHFIKDVNDTEYKLWDNKGTAVRSTFDIVLGADNAIGNALKKYDAKTFLLQIGEDYNEDKALDSVKSTQVVTYDGTFTLPTAEEKTGLTFVGYYLLGTDTCIASYNKATGVMTYTSSTWIWDDGKDWVTTGDTQTTLQLEQRYTRNEYTATIKTTTDVLNDDGTYKVNTETKKFTYDKPYNAITVPTKKGYDFGGYKVVGGTYDGQTVWTTAGASTKTAWLLAENVTVEAIWTPKTYHVKYPQGDFTIVYDANTETVKTDGKTGHTFKGYKLPDANGGDKVFGSDGKPTSAIWRYDLGANGTEVTLSSIFETNSYAIKTDYEGEFPDQTLGVMYGGQYGNLTVPEKKGYKLLGYVAKGTQLPEDLTNLEGINFYFDETGKGEKYYNNASDTTVVPVWKAETYTIRLGDTGKTIQVTYDQATPTYTGGSPSKEYCEFLGWYYGNGVLFRANGIPSLNVWNLDLGEDGAVVMLPARYTDPVYPEEEVEEEIEEGEDTSEETSEETSEHPFEPVEKPEEEPEPEPKTRSNFLDALKTAAPYVGITAGVVVFFGAATALVFSILFGLGRIAGLYAVNASSRKRKFSQFVFVSTMNSYERTGLTKFRINMPKKYFHTMNSNLDNTQLVVKLSKAFVVKNVGQKIIIGYPNLAGEYDVAENIEI